VICLVTDRHRVGSARDGADGLVDLVAAAADAGVDVIQVRERDMEARQLATLVRRCVDAVRGTRTKVLVNDRADVAVGAGAHGVHLRSDSIAAARLRPLLAADALVGRSVHSAEEAAAVSLAGGVDYLILGTVFETPSKPSARPMTTDELSSACRRSSVPVLAIGGMNVERASLVARAGGGGVAAIGLFIPPPGEPARGYLRHVVADIRRAFDTYGSVS
jgi:thiamine-phosphate pyrophosphorylase